MSLVSAGGVEGVHPLGEGVFSFPPAGGRGRLSVTEDALTPYGGLVPWAAFTKHIGIAENLAGDCPVTRTSPNAAPVYDVIQSFMRTALTDGKRSVFITAPAEYKVAEVATPVLRATPFDTGDLMMPLGLLTRE